MNLFNKPFNTVIFLIGITVVARLAFDSFDLSTEYMYYIYLLMSVLGSYMGIRQQRMLSDEDFTFVMDLKAGMRVAGFYGLLVAVFVFIYYSWINPYYFEQLLATRADEMARVYAENGIPQEEITKHIEQFKSFNAQFMSPLPWANMTLFALVFLGAFYSSILALIIRRFPQMMPK